MELVCTDTTASVIAAQIFLSFTAAMIAVAAVSAAGLIAGFAPGGESPVVAQAQPAN